MDEASEFIENFLEHAGMTKEEISAYNRQYYLKTRKLKGRPKGGDFPQPRTAASKKPRVADRGDSMKRVKSKSSAQVRAEARRRLKKNQGSGAAVKRIQENEQKIIRARRAAAKLPKDKRNVVEKKLDALEKKVKKAKKKLKNPFTKKNIDRSLPVIRRS